MWKGWKELHCHIDSYLSMSWSLSSSGSPLGILDVKRGGIESWDEGELVLTVLAKLLGTRPWWGEGVGDTPSSLPGDLESSLLAPGDSLPSSLGVLEPSWPYLESRGVCLSVWGVSERVVFGDPGALDLESLQGNTPAAPPNRDCSRFFLQEANISSLRAANPAAGWFCWDPKKNHLLQLETNFRQLNGFISLFAFNSRLILGIHFRLKNKT